MQRLNTVNPSIDGKYIAPAAAEGKLEVEPDIGPDLAQALAAQRIITLGRSAGDGSNTPRVERRR